MILLKAKCGQGNLENKKGLVQSPDLIIKEFKNFFVGENGVKPVFSVKEFSQESGLDKTHKKLYEKAKKLVSEELVTVGGDHSITYPLFKAFSEEHDEVGLVYFDAHADCEHDMNPPSYEDVLRKIISDGLVKPWRTILVGVRNMTQREKTFLEDSKIKVFSMKDLASDGLKEVLESIRYLLSKCENVYASFDVDVVDPAFAPGTGWPEPGGLTSRQALQLVQSLGVLKKVKAFDLVECTDESSTVRLASKILFEYMAHKQK